MTDTDLERDAKGWPICCGERVGIDMGEDPPVGLCDQCGRRFEIEGETETTEITIADLLGDAARVLRDTGKPALAKAVTIARGMLDEERGETWLRDVLRVLDEAEGVVATAREGNETVVLDGLARALDDCSTWGLNPQQRARNALFEIQSALALLLSIAGRHEGTERDDDQLKEIRNTVERLMKGLGFTIE